MIPHHLIAVMASERTHVRDPEVHRLAEKIIDSQTREIVQMKAMITRLEAHTTPAGAPDFPPCLDRRFAQLVAEMSESTGINTLESIN